MKRYIGVKQVEAKPMSLGGYNVHRRWIIPADEDPERPGYLVKYPDGYESWCPKEIFEAANTMLEADNNTITSMDVGRMIAKAETTTLGGKTTVVQATLVNGFVITESSSCVDPANYDEKMGAEICMSKILDKVWFLMGFLLQTALCGFNHVPYDERTV